MVGRLDGWLQTSGELIDNRTGPSGGGETAVALAADPLGYVPNTGA